MTKVGVTLDDPGFWQGGFDVLAGMVDEFEALWREYQVQEPKSTGTGT